MGTPTSLTLSNRAVEKLTVEKDTVFWHETRCTNPHLESPRASLQTSSGPTGVRIPLSRKMPRP